MTGTTRRDDPKSKLPQIGIDQMTLVLMPDDLETLGHLPGSEVQPKLEGIVESLLAETNLEGVFGEIAPNPRKCDPIGHYGKRFSLGSPDSGRVLIGYSPNRPGTGIALYMSASGLRRWCEGMREGPGKLAERAFMTAGATGHMSRVDLTLDYLDSDISLDDLYEELRGGEIVVKRLQRHSRGNEATAERKCRWTLKYIGEIGERSNIQTIYYETKSTKIVRIYDKKAQLEESGRKGNPNPYDQEKARHHDSWIRVELQLPRKYAEPFGDLLVQHRESTAGLVARAFLQLCRFKAVEDGKDMGFAPWYAPLDKAYETGNLIVRLGSRRRDGSLDKRFLYFLERLFSPMREILETFPDLTDEDVMGSALSMYRDYARTYEPSKSIEDRARCHSDGYRQAFPSGRAWLKQLGPQLKRPR